MAKINMPKMDMPKMDSILGGTGNMLGNAQSSVNINKIANDGLSKVEGLAKKVGINISIPKVNLNTNDITSSITGSFSDVSKQYDSAMKEVNSAQNINTDDLLKDADLSKINGLSFN